MPNIIIAPTVKLPIKDKLIRFFGRFFYAGPTLAWRTFLGNHASMWNLAQAFPRLTMKIYRPYMAKDVPCAARVQALIDHYRFMQERGFMHMVERLSNQPTTIGEFLGKNGTAYQLELYGMLLGSYEGEFSLRLASEGTQLYRASFLFGQEDGASFLKLACLQGVRADNGALFVKDMTRDFHACRPKNLMVAVLRDIGAYFGCRSTILVGNENRILARRLLRPKPEVSADYDATWSDMGAVKRPDGDFELPCTDIIKTNLDDVQSKKRSESRKRNALLEAIFASVRLSLDEEKSAGEGSAPVRRKLRPVPSQNADAANPAPHAGNAPVLES